MVPRVGLFLVFFRVGSRRKRFFGPFSPPVHLSRGRGTQIGPYRGHLWGSGDGNLHFSHVFVGVGGRQHAFFLVFWGVGGRKPAFFLGFVRVREAVGGRQQGQMALKQRLTESGLRPIEVSFHPKDDCFCCFFSVWPLSWEKARLTESGLRPIEVALFPKDNSVFCFFSFWPLGWEVGRFAGRWGVGFGPQKC